MARVGFLAPWALALCGLAQGAAAGIITSPETSSPANEVPPPAAAPADTDDDLLAEPVATEAAPATSSAALRPTTRYAVVGEAGWAVLPVPSLGLSGSVLLASDLYLEAAYAQGLLHLYFFKVYTDVAAVRAKKFWGNSFYGFGGIGRRRIGAEFTPSSLIGTSVLDAKAEVTELVAEVGLGNRWQWRRVTMGVDWFGVMLPLARLGGTDSFPDRLVSKDVRDQKSKVFDSVAGGRSYEAMRLSIGVVF